MSFLESGIPGVDDLFHGGFPKGKTILLSGPPGSGKTVFGMQFLIAGALANEPGILVAFDDLPSHVRKDMESFGWGGVEELESIDPPLLTIVDGFASRVGLTSTERFQIRANVDSLLITLMDVLRKTGAVRIVIDSLTTLSSASRSVEQVRKEILTLSAILGEQGCTTLLTAELGGVSSSAQLLGAVGRFGIEEYSSQGAIVLNYVEREDGEFVRTILVQKMRGHRHIFGWREAEISEDGFTVYPHKKVGRV